MPQQNAAANGHLNTYKFQGQKRQDELSLNWDASKWRSYDYAIGRWMNIDPLAETSRRFSPYVYALNNPVYFIDPDGMQARYNWEEHDKGNKGVYTDDETNENVSFETALAEVTGDSDGGPSDPPTEEERLSELVTIRGK